VLVAGAAADEQGHALVSRQPAVPTSHHRTLPPLQATRGNVDVLWDVSQCSQRISTAKVRRVRAAQQHAAAIAAAEGEAAEGGPSPAAARQLRVPEEDPEAPLSAEVVHKLLIGHYMAKYKRLGIPERTPGLQTEQLMALVAGQQRAIDAQDSKMGLGESGYSGDGWDSSGSGD
jgi:hypothetical protein